MGNAAKSISELLDAGIEIENPEARKAFLRGVILADSVLENPEARKAFLKGVILADSVLKPEDRASAGGCAVCPHLKEPTESQIRALAAKIELPESAKSNNPYPFTFFGDNERATEEPGELHIEGFDIVEDDRDYPTDLKDYRRFDIVEASVYLEPTDWTYTLRFFNATECEVQERVLSLWPHWG